MMSFNAINELVLKIAREKLEKQGHIHCPVNGWDCPYYDANGCCMMWPDTDPVDECDDFGTFWNKGDDYVCFDNHEGD